MVKKRIKRKASVSNSNFGKCAENFDKNSSQLLEKEFSCVSKDHETSCKNLDIYFNRKISEKVSMAHQLGATMFGITNTTRRSKDLPTTSTNGTRANKVINQKTKIKSISHHSYIDSDHLTLWYHPMTTLSYFIQELFEYIVHFGKKIYHYKKAVLCTVFFILLFFILGRISGPQQIFFKALEVKLQWWLYWIGLGVLSSVGLGTGLHTFVLYLGPHIAAVTMAAYECGALNFPEPPYPDKIICPSMVDITWPVGIWNIMGKVRVESMLWGAGTALGELPPYFMARAARTSQQTKKEHESDELKELEDLESLEDNMNLTRVMKLKKKMKNFVQNFGFLGIMACASIPNPLFDLAGLTCGHYLIPFWTFFGATLIGKAVIKMHIQQLAVIVAFNEELLDKAISFLIYIPVIGKKLQEPLKKYLMEQKRKLHEKASTEGATTLSWLFDKFVLIMVVYFLITIIHALARNHHRRHTKSVSD